MSRYVIVDLEMCRVPKGMRRETFGFSNELIQIGAVLLDDSLEITDTFMTLVSPEYGIVDTYIEELTGITSSAVKTAPSTQTALEAFVSWLPDDAVLVSWSENDETQIRKEIEGKGLIIEGIDGYLDNWIDCQQTFAEKMNAPKKYRLSEALIIADINYTDGEHDALVDARNTAVLFSKMMHEPTLRLSSYYVASEEHSRAMYNPFAELLANYKCVV